MERGGGAADNLQYYFSKFWNNVEQIYNNLEQLKVDQNLA